MTHIDLVPLPGNPPHRKPLRLQGYDYSSPGGYFVTIVTQFRVALFGKIEDGEIILNNAGKMILKWWNELPNKFPSITLAESIIMPNHMHGVIIIHENVGADLRVCPDTEGTQTQGAHSGAPLPRPNAPLSQIVQWFKTMTTNEYILGVKQSGWPPFPKRLWQRNYFEHIIRDEEDYERIASYVLDNPANWEQDEENPNTPCSDPLHLKTK